MRPYKPHLTKQEIQELKYEYNYCGRSIEELSEKYQIHKATVQYHCWPSVKARKDAYSKAYYEENKEDHRVYAKQYHEERPNYFKNYYRQKQKASAEYYASRREHYKEIFHKNYLTRHIKEIIRDNFDCDMHGVAFTTDLGRDIVKTLYSSKKDGVSVYIMNLVGHKYFAVTGLPKEEQDKITKFYWDLYIKYNTNEI